VSRPFAPSSVAALRHRNFRLLWIGQLISTTGSMMQNWAVLWHVSLIVPESQKGIALGIVGFVKFVPIVAFSLVGGVVADAVDRRRLMLLTNTLLTLIAGALAVATLRGLHVVWPIYLLTALSSAVGVFDAPARQSLVPSLVPARDFPNAISLNTIMFQAACVLGPGLSGLVIAAANVAWVYLLNAVSFLAVVTALVMMRDVPQRAASARSEISLKAAVEGLRYVFSTPMIRSTMLLDFFATFFSSASALLPIFAQDILHVGPVGFGQLAAAASVGALITSAILVQHVDKIVNRGRVLLWAVFAYGAATVAFGLSTSFWLTLVCLAITGAADTVSMVLRNIIRQLTTPDHLRGRMTSVNMIFFMGGPQLGELEAGAVANVLGAPFSVVSGGIGCLVATAWIALKTPPLRHYRREDSAVDAA
jgi:MFS family permease